MNPMRQIRIEKVTLNIGAGEPGEKVDLMKELLERITGRKVVKTKAKRRIPTWHLRPGLEIGVKVTVRGKDAKELLKKLLAAVGNKLKRSCFDKFGNVNFGVEEYIHIPGMKYDPKIGMQGLNVCVTLERPGYRVKRRKVKRSKIGKKHLITPEEAMEFMRKEFGVVVE
ncbi:50S ribosomal protein L5 [Nanoarchaeota archaeon]|nr:MAG: 50S ribosomal protein L5 [Nanoarchaeota archaeon]